MKNFAPALLFLIVLAGCADRQRTTTLASLEPAPSEAIIALNVSNGHYMYFDTVYGNGKVELSVRNPKPDPKWAPMNGLCVRSASEGDQVCLKFSLTNPGSNEIGGVKEVLGEGRKTLRSSEVLKGVFHVGEPITIDMQANGNEVRFSVNGAPAASYSLPGKPAIMTLLCSTGTCAMRL